jgi:hypothetical protein
LELGHDPLRNDLSDSLKPLLHVDLTLRIVAASFIFDEIFFTNFLEVCVDGAVY